MRTSFRTIALVFGREFRAYFATPLAAVFLLVFLALSAGLAFFAGGFFERGQADLGPFFAWHPWLFLILMPAIGMRLWAEERRSGVIELLMTLPVIVWWTGMGWVEALIADIGLAIAYTIYAFLFNLGYDRLFPIAPADGDAAAAAGLAAER